MKQGAEGFPWERIMRVGLGQLRLAPETFWAMTPREFEAAMRGALGIVSGNEPFDRMSLNRLMQRFPDNQQEE